MILKITSKDVTHGFYLDGYGIKEVLYTDVTVTVKFVANQVGKFTFRCAVTCGNFHPYMIGELRVQPNVTFYTGIVLASLIVMMMIGLTYRQTVKMTENLSIPMAN